MKRTIIILLTAVLAVNAWAENKDRGDTYTGIEREQEGVFEDDGGQAAAEVQVNRSGVQVELQFYTQSFRLNEPVQVTLNVINVSDQEVRFKISSLVYETFFFVMRTPRNEEIPLQDRFQVEKKEHRSSAGDFREVRLMPGESFSRKVDVSEWFDIREPGYYYLKGVFMPDPDKPETRVESFDYKILLKPPAVVEIKQKEEDQRQSEAIEQAKALPPYDAIVDFLDAKMKKDWTRFLSHIDAERLIRSFETYYKAWDSARSGRYKLEVVDEFRRYLTTYWQDRILRYEIQETVIKQDKAQVTAEVEYKVRNTSYVHRYDFYLYKNHANQWLIYDYVVYRVRE